MIIRKNLEVSNDFSRYSNNFVNPVVPDGYRHIGGTNWKTGFKIERIKDGSVLEFIPVGTLKNNGTLDGKKFNEKFGRRTFGQENMDEMGEEPIYGTMNVLWNQFQSVREYGGFYVTYPVSRSESLKPISIFSKKPWTMVDFERAVYLASVFENDNGIKSHLLFGAEYDSIIEWYIESNRITLKEATDSSYENEEKEIFNNDVLTFDNVAVWTQEKTVKGTKARPAVRGATLKRDGTKNPLTGRQETPMYIKRPYIGLQIALFIPIM